MNPKSLIKRKVWQFKKYIYDRNCQNNKYEIPILRKKDITEDDLFSSVQDKVFKIMFQNKGNKLFTCYLLSLIFDLDIVSFYDNVEQLNIELPLNRVENTNQRVDYLGKIENTVFSIEMNNTNVLSRNEIYADRIKLSFEKIGEPINNVSVIQLNITFEIYHLSFHLGKCS